ncbi:MAG: type II toxin-antitoxin system HigB family toxin [Ignavibacteriae bacterium]|nr:type II toxin-antitoxin system HigB family toxin [Ignavibacteriota bacterium]
MRIIARNTLKIFWTNNHDAEQPIKAWFAEAEKSSWKSPNEIKDKYKSASIITNKRVVFNIKGNKYRLVVDIEYRLGIVFIIWIGSHKDYDKLDIKEINYVKTDKK